MGGRIDIGLVCGGRYHDFDFARLELLKLLAEDQRHRVHVAADYSDTDALLAGRVLITYTCDLLPGEDQQAALGDWLRGGGRWFALHGTNSVLEFVRGKGWDAPHRAPDYMALLGSRFIAHPPIRPYRVTVSDPSHPLVAGLEPFETDDELYLCEYYGDLHPLLETQFDGLAAGFVRDDWRNAGRQLVCYLHEVDAGQVLYLTLGHCRGRYDMQPLMEEYPHVERGSWKLPVFHELLRRGIRWCAAGEPCEAGH